MIQKRHFFSLLKYLSLLFFFIFAFVSLSLLPADWSFLRKKSYPIQKNWNQRSYIATSAFSELSPYIERPELLLNLKSQVIRSNAHREVAIIEVEGKKMLLKVHKDLKGLSHIKKLLFTMSPGFRSWHYGHFLLSQNILTPAPLALFEKRWGPFWKTQYLVTEYLCEAKPLIEELKHEKSLSEHLFCELKSQLRALSQNKLIHFDYGCRNIMLQNQKLYLIDLDDLHAYQTKSPFFRSLFEKKHLDKIRRELTMPTSLQAELSL